MVVCVVFILTQSTVQPVSTKVIKSHILVREQVEMKVKVTSMLQTPVVAGCRLIACIPTKSCKTSLRHQEEVVLHIVTKWQTGKKNVRSIRSYRLTMRMTQLAMCRISVAEKMMSTSRLNLPLRSTRRSSKMKSSRKSPMIKNRKKILISSRRRSHNSLLKLASR